MKVATTFATVIFLIVVALITLDLTDNGFRKVQPRKYQNRDEHGRKIIFNSHILDTTITPDVSGNVENKYSYQNFKRVFRTASPFGTASIEAPLDVLRTWLVHVSPTQLLTEQFKLSVSQTIGVELGPYLPHNTFAIVTTEEIAKLAASVTGVAWVGPYPNEAKLNGNLLAWRTNPRKAPASLVHYTLLLELSPMTRSTQDLMAVVNAWQHEADSLGFGVELARMSGVRNNRLLLKRKTPSSRDELDSVVNWLLAKPELFVVETQLEQHLRNQEAQWITQSGNDPASVGDSAARPIWSHGLHGEGQIVGCADSGLDWDHCFFRDPGSDAPSSTVNHDARKVIAYLPYGDTKDDSDGHGTHVCGSITGDALFYTGPSLITNHNGQAPKAQLFFIDIGLTGGGLEGLNDRDYGQDLYQPAYDAGARIHTNSWGANENVYDTGAVSVDEYVYEHPDMLILYAAGNDGLREGSVTGTVGTPATAKNIITVGASQTSNQGWINQLKYVDWEDKRKQAAEALSEPNIDCCSSSNSRVKAYCCESYVAAQITASPERHEYSCMADFSSRGPTADGRVKPELVAPGQFVVSSRSDGNPSTPSSKDQCKTDTTALMSIAGTSMATPTLAGNAALLRQYLVDGYYPTGSPTPANSIHPSASLMKALLIAGAQSLTGEIDANNDGNSWTSLADGTYPFVIYQGFGRVTLDRTMWFTGETRFNLWFLDDIPISTGEDKVYKVSASSSCQSCTVHVVVAWTDYPGTSSASIASVNNVDVYVGRTLDDALAGNFRTLRDSRNNAEHVLFPDVQSGDVLYVMLRGINVPQGPQKVSLVVNGLFDRQTAQLDTTGAFAVPADHFPEASDSDYFPVGPVVGGVVGGSMLVLLIGLLVKFLKGKSGS